MLYELRGTVGSREKTARPQPKPAGDIRGRAIVEFLGNWGDTGSIYVWSEMTTSQ